MDIGSISAGITSLKAAKDIAETLINLRDTAKFQSAIVELNGKILAAQTDQFALLERVRELEGTVTALQEWNAEKKRYALRDYGGGTFAYELRPEEANGEPPHRICANCYQRGQKSILQFNYRSSVGQDQFHCQNCDKEFGLGHRSEPRYPSRANRSPLAV